MTVAGICRITCDVNVLLEVSGDDDFDEDAHDISQTHHDIVSLVRIVKLVMMVLMTTTQVRQRRQGSCWNRTSRVNASSSALPGLSEGDTFLVLVVVLVLGDNF